MRHILIILLSLILTIGLSSAKGPATLEQMLSLLDDAVSDNSIYTDLRFARIDSMKSRLTQSDPELYLAIGNDLKGIAIDSALKYYNLGIKSAISNNDLITLQRLEIERAATLPIMGITKESIETFDSIKSNRLYDQNRETFYECGNRLYFYISSFYPEAGQRKQFMRQGLLYTDSLLSILPANSPKHKLYSAQVHYIRGNRPAAIALLDELIDSVPFNDNIFARAASMRASCDENRNTDSFLYYLAMSAYSDIISGTREATSLQRLGVALYDDDDVSRAYNYLILSLDNAVKSGARIRAIECSQAMPYIAQSFHEQDLHKVTWLWILVILLSAALIGIVIFIIYLRHDKNKLEILRMRLTKANYAKETYMSQFLSLCSIYMERLEEFNKFVGRKITAGQTEDLYDQIKSGKILQEQSNLFYSIFDNAFIHIYPTFVAEVNTLLQTDKRITLANSQRLNTELRILAFMRLGIDDSSQIARFLGLSLNTIYTYRNKMKCRAINRDTFEEDIKSIGRIR